VNAAYLERESLAYTIIAEGVQWIDAGTPDALVSASLAIQEATVNLASEIGYVELAAFRRGYLERSALLAIAADTPSDAYAARLRSAVEREAR
jgi:glucose-1-phosphate thymidylyltransferase